MSRFSPWYQVVNPDGERFGLRFVEWRGDLAYLVNTAAAAYLADPITGRVEGTESCAGISLRLAQGAWVRLNHRFLARDSESAREEAKRGRCLYALATGMNAPLPGYCGDPADPESARCADHRRLEFEAAAREERLRIVARLRMKAFEQRKLGDPTRGTRTYEWQTYDAIALAFIAEADALEAEDPSKERAEALAELDEHFKNAAPLSAARAAELDELLRKPGGPSRG